MSNASEKLTVEIWSDVICPYSYIGVNRFEKALGEFEHADHVQVVHRSFRLMPNAAPIASEDVIAQKFGVPLSQVGPLIEGMEQKAASAGLTYHLGGTRLGDTLDAHRLRKFAATKGKADSVVERLFRGFFTENASVLDREGLLALATDAGLERSEAEAVLDGDAFHTEVEADQRRQQAVGGQGVPFFLIDGKPVVAAEQPAMVAALQQAWTMRASGAVAA